MFKYCMLYYSRQFSSTLFSLLNLESHTLNPYDSLAQMQKSPPYFTHVPFKVNLLYVFANILGTTMSKYKSFSMLKGRKVQNDIKLKPPFNNVQLFFLNMSDALSTWQHNVRQHDQSENASNALHI